MSLLPLVRPLTTVDAVGCLTAGAVLALVPAASTAVDPSGRSRFPLAAALVATGAGLVWASARPGPMSLGTAAAVNTGWVGLCLAVARSRPTPAGRALVLATAGLDAVAGAVQLAGAIGARR